MFDDAINASKNDGILGLQDRNAYLEALGGRHTGRTN